MPTKYRLAFVLLLVLGLAGLTARPGLTQDAKDAKDVKADPSVERMRKDITFLASDDCEGRGVGTLGLEMAAHYVAVQFSHAGLKPGGVKGTYFQPFPFAMGTELDGESTLTLVGKDDKKRALKQGVDFQVLGSSAASAFTAPVVFVGYGLTVTGKGNAYDDYAGLDVKGKIVIALRRLPRWNDKDSPLGGAGKDQRAALVSKQLRAENAKAAAIILVNDASETKDNLIGFNPALLGGRPSIPFVQMKRAVLDELLRDSIGKSLDDIEKAIDKDLKPQSAVLKNGPVTLNVKVKRKEAIVKNVIGTLEGSGPLKDETIVVGAHYDHLGYGGFGSLAPDKKGKIHHGADDNASGSTSVIELARRFAAMKDRQGRRLVFMTFTAEESGLVGSRFYCNDEPIFALRDTAAMFNLDMVGRLNPRIIQIDERIVTVGDDDGKDAKTYDLADGCKYYRLVKGAKEQILDGVQAKVFMKIPPKGLSAALVTDAKNKVTAITLTGEPKLHVLGTDTAKEFDALVAKHNPGFDLFKDTSGIFGASDHASFYDKKIPVLFLFSGFHPDYHKPSDTSDKINLSGMKRIVDFSERIIDDLATNPTRPEYLVRKSSGGGGPKGPKLLFTPDYQFLGKGMRIAAVTAGGPAQLAGLKDGDVIVEIAGKTVPNLSGFMTEMAKQKVGIALEVKILRDSKEMLLKVTPK